MKTFPMNDIKINLIYEWPSVFFVLRKKNIYIHNLFLRFYYNISASFIFASLRLYNSIYIFFGLSFCTNKSGYTLFIKFKIHILTIFLSYS